MTARNGRDVCRCDTLAPAAPLVHNPPGQPELTWRVATHPVSLRRLRAAMAGDPASSPAVRALALHDADEPVVALLDAWAYVCDVVSFYTERIATEGFLRTATEPASARELARTLAHELRPGVAAVTDLAFTVDDAPGAPERAEVPAGTPVQTVPGPGQLPQTFETASDLVARACWNAIPVAAARPQPLPFGTTGVWLRGTGHALRPGDRVLVVGRERLAYGRAAERDRVPGDDERWDFRTVEEAVEQPGWTRLRIRPGLGHRPERELVAERDVEVFAFDERANLFGWNAPDPTFIDKAAATTLPDGRKTWTDFAVTVPGTADVLELDGDHPRLAGGDHTEVAAASWLVLESPDHIELCRVTDVRADGAARYAVSGRITRVTADVLENAAKFDRRNTLAHCVSRRLPADAEPLTGPVEGATLKLTPTDPPLPSGRAVLVTGHPHGAAPTGPGTPAGPDAMTAPPPPVCERAVVLASEVRDGIMTVILDHELPTPIDPWTLRVLANTVTATHGETVTEVLGSGDGQVSFARLRPRRAPLTHLRAPTPSGARSTLELRVDGVAWTEVDSLAESSGTDRVFTVRQEEGGAVRLVLGDGVHGARPPSGQENVTATYRIGIGEDGAADAGRISLLTRRPMGVRTVANPGPTRGWAAPETLTDARRNAPLRIRTLGRAVSVADHEDFAAGFAGVGKACADGVWDGTGTAVVVTIVGAAADRVGDGLRDDLRTALEQARDPSTRLEVEHGEPLWFGVQVEVRHDPAYRRAAVEDAVRAALDDGFGPGARDFGEPVTAAAVLVAVRRAPGVVACTMPRLTRLPGGVPGRVPVESAPAPGEAAAAQVLRAARARWTGTEILAAQLLGLAPGAVEIGEMP
ncbi:baseplate J/gp47 family protein [Streptomyces scabiei]|uniref:baseplate J/gp47 family protein n=1 Tax=Streptomyces scabiei TaxID=1930 RepID=UPI0038F84D22